MKLKEVMATDFFTITNDAIISEAADLFLRHSVEMIVVVDSDNSFVGTVTLESLLGAIRSKTNPNSSILQCLAQKTKCLPPEVDLEEIGKFSEDQFLAIENGSVLGVFYKPRISHLFEQGSPELSFEFNTFLDFIHNPVVVIDSDGGGDHLESISRDNI